MFHIFDARFWEAALLPIAVVVVIAFSSCMDFFIGQFISLSWWYAANFYAMGYAFQVLHPQPAARSLAHGCSPFGGARALWLWSAGIAALEMTTYHAAGAHKVAHALGTTLYGLCGCVWLHAVLTPWLCVPKSWRPHKVFRYVAEHRLLELQRQSSLRCGHGHGSGRSGHEPRASAPPPPGGDGPPPLSCSAPPPDGPLSDTEVVRYASGSPRSSGAGRAAGPRRRIGVAAAETPSTCAGHVALATAGYALFVTWWCAGGSRGDGAAPPSPHRPGPLGVHAVGGAALSQRRSGGEHLPTLRQRPAGAPAIGAVGALGRAAISGAPRADGRRGGVPGGQLLRAARGAAGAAAATLAGSGGAAGAGVLHDSGLLADADRNTSREMLETWRATYLGSGQHAAGWPAAGRIRGGGGATLQTPNTATLLEELRNLTDLVAARRGEPGGRVAAPPAPPPAGLSSASSAAAAAGSATGAAAAPGAAVEPAAAVGEGEEEKEGSPQQYALRQTSMEGPGSPAPPPRLPSGAAALAGHAPLAPAVAAPAAAPAEPPPAAVAPSLLAPAPPPLEVVVHLTLRAWGEVLLLGCASMTLLWLVDRRKSFRFSIPYMICYNVLCLRVPDLLGHTVISSVGEAHLYTSPALATTGISCTYMGAMQLYLAFLGWVCQNMSSQHLFPRFYFVAQMYYYLFWYMMLMVVSPAGIEDLSFWALVTMLNGNYLVSNLGMPQYLYSALIRRPLPPDPPLKVLFDMKLAVQDQLADVVSLLIVPAIATSFHICSSLSVAEYPRGPLASLWRRFGALLVARLLSGLLTEEFFRRRVELLYKADAMELQLLPLDSQNRLRYLNDVCVGPKLAHESMRNLERCEVYFTAVAVATTFAVFHRGDVPARYAFIAFGV